ncbi:hypothetical protein NAEGRDRAFT_80679 [Naegleria gruberi]|uniref:Uncharacterized protein n=1 Tax=Naegleria gruberi TaxID=5762 RepID=D2VNV8_NAEGR|nr:uncharacterized protein NAEGRDRAFT_80679 [Naegleria gruberi]EFC41486.1 hypothetical protein NAEGRDRAFT_80679 [Naegleria gruberi]|eukprot:XP_002674230.1 hypothetical protein NAEGRDRAFT_80679 [Naegleria gruberi strain NEG-M]
MSQSMKGFNLTKLSEGNAHFGEQVGNQLYEDYLPSLMATQLNCAKYFDLKVDDEKTKNDPERTHISESEYMKSVTGCIAESLCPKTFSEQNKSNKDCVSKLIQMNADWKANVPQDKEVQFKKDLKDCMTEVKKCAAEFILHGSSGN